MFYVDGSSTKRIDDYAVWNITNEKGDIVCSCHGPMAALVAATACRELRNKTIVDIPNVRDYTKLD